MMKQQRKPLRKFGGTPPPIVRQIAAERLQAAAMEHVGQTDCWLWNQELTSDGYGQITIAGKIAGYEFEGQYRFLVHRLSFEVFKGLIPRGNVVMHQCDQRACFNPQHLFLGTHSENMHDKHVKKRGWKGVNERVDQLEKQMAELWAWFNTHERKG